MYFWEVFFRWFIPETLQRKVEEKSSSCTTMCCGWSIADRLLLQCRDNHFLFFPAHASSLIALLAHALWIQYWQYSVSSQQDLLVEVKILTLRELRHTSIKTVQSWFVRRVLPESRQRYKWHGRGKKQMEAKCTTSPPFYESYLSLS